MTPAQHTRRYCYIILLMLANQIYCRRTAPEGQDGGLSGAKWIGTSVP